MFASEPFSISASRSRFRADISTWLYRIAFRKALDRLRNKSRMTTCELIEEISAYPEHLENAMEFMIEEERKELIKKCIFQLPEQEAAIITLFYFEDQSVKDISLLPALAKIM